MKQIKDKCCQIKSVQVFKHKEDLTVGMDQNCLWSIGYCSSLNKFNMPSCSAPNCKSRSMKGCGLSFHEFPSDIDRRVVWIQNLGRPNWSPSQKSLLCSLHFEKDSFVETDWLVARNRLKKDAVPTIFHDLKGQTILKKVKKFQPNLKTKPLKLKRQRNPEEPFSKKELADPLALFDVPKKSKSSSTQRAEDQIISELESNLAKEVARNQLLSGNLRAVEEQKRFLETNLRQVRDLFQNLNDRDLLSNEAIETIKASSIQILADIVL